MLKIISFIFLIFIFVGCTDGPKPGNKKNFPMPPSAQIEQFDDNWPPKDSQEDNVDISDLSNQTDINETNHEDRKIVNHIPFPAKEYNNLSLTGSSAIQGKIVIQTNDGKIVSGSDARLYLNPYTSYSKQWYKENYLHGNLMDGTDDRLYKYLKFTTANDNGGFVLNNIPKGKYYLVGTVVCGQECGFDGIKNIRIVSEVSVDNNATISVNLVKALNN
ncbi:MAG: carboxypeptidase regulatory-like domain-containing protein [Sulfurovaceae bacterium]|nr:carboxypeptidase regulatory-like domain-containing protein [Sulfurovaceae bacterium]